MEYNSILNVSQKQTKYINIVFIIGTHMWKSFDTTKT